MLLVSEKDFKKSQWQTVSDPKVNNIIHYFWDLRSHFKKKYVISEESKKYFEKIEESIERLESIPRLHWNNEYAGTMEIVRLFVPNLPELDQHLDKAYKEKQANIPFEFYKKLQAEVLPKPQEPQYCKIL